MTDWVFYRLLPFSGFFHDPSMQVRFLHDVATIRKIIV